MHHARLLHQPLLDRAGQGGHRGALGFHQILGCGRRAAPAPPPAAQAEAGRGHCHRNPAASGGARGRQGAARGRGCRSGQRRRVRCVRHAPRLQGVESAPRAQLQAPERVSAAAGAVQQRDSVPEGLQALAHTEEARPPVDPQAQSHRRLQAGARGGGGSWRERERRGEERNRGEDSREGVKGGGEEGEVRGEKSGREDGGTRGGERRAAERQSRSGRSQQTDKGGHVDF